ncbi:MAG: hypothetical protein NUV70_07125 [Caldiserica bacterium]|jgi:hypothetical protein|nr:hypothetical protein [Caldisericota bacterium]
MVNNAIWPFIPERLVYWYLRLNGFLILENFIIHPDQGHLQRTDADFLGVRFKHRRELLINSMEDDPRVSDCSTFCNVIIAEVKRGQCALNGPWTNPSDENMHRILRAIGCFEEREMEDAAIALYQKGRFQNDNITCRLLAFGNQKGKLPIEGVRQILFSDVIQFIYKRFSDYPRQKSSVANWPRDGRKLRYLFDRCGSEDEFEEEVRKAFGLPRTGNRSEDQ